MTNYVMKQKKKLLQLLGLVDKQKLEGVGHLFKMQANQLTAKNLDIFEYS